MATNKQGKGATLSFVHDGGTYTGTIGDISESGRSVEDNEVTHMGSANTEHTPAEIPSQGEISADVFHDSESLSPAQGTVGVLTMTYPLSLSTNTVPHTRTGDAYIMDVSNSVPVKGTMMTGLKYKFMGTNYVEVPESAS